MSQSGYVSVTSVGVCQAQQCLRVSGRAQGVPTICAQRQVGNLKVMEGRTALSTSTCHRALDPGGGRRDGVSGGWGPGWVGALDPPHGGGKLPADRGTYTRLSHLCMRAEPLSCDESIAFVT